ncbi:hypothetical protein KKC1_17130 [Calderihabitans maritimus]|uniref:Uncharacterized protein n=1 Tax=Calderihabitans maritimus TaxID=1246530 RepID=A0A1Z5HSQ1_9FIRM|nr:hypothetical protein KKC1_17130 [Calderihabitans maritimus]
MSPPVAGSSQPHIPGISRSGTGTHVRRQLRYAVGTQS